MYSCSDEWVPDMDGGGITRGNVAPGRKEFHELDGFLVKGVSPLGSSGGYGVRAEMLKNMPLKMFSREAKMFR